MEQVSPYQIFLGRLRSILLAVLIATAYGCKKGGDTAGSGSSMLATVRSAAFSTTTVTTDYRNDILQIIGSTSTEEIRFILEYKGIGTYPITLTWDAEKLAEFKHGGVIYNTVSGQLVLTVTSPVLKGTFNLNLEDGSKITEGSFTAQRL